MTRRQAVENLLENESITDGLTDREAQLLIDWCVKHIKSTSSDAELPELVAYLRVCVRAISRFCNAIPQGRVKAQFDRVVERCQIGPTAVETIGDLVHQAAPAEQVITTILNTMEKSQ